MKIIVADRQWMVRFSVTHLFATAAPEATVTAVDSLAAFQSALVDGPRPAVVLLDDTLVADDEEAVFAQIRLAAPAAAIGILCTSIDRERMLKVIYFGAVAVILKSEEREAITDALRLLLSGQVALPRHLLAQGPAADTGGSTRRESRAGVLTPREREVIGLLGCGRTVRRIAEDLKLSPHTVRVHVANIMKKLDLPNRPALMHFAVTAHGRKESETAHQ